MTLVSILPEEEISEMELQILDMWFVADEIMYRSLDIQWKDEELQGSRLVSRTTARPASYPSLVHIVP